MKVLDYDVKNPVETKRTFQEEWAPHKRQDPKSMEWWYLTANVHDAKGNVIRFDGVTIRQNGYCHAPLAKIWQSWGWTYEFPIEVEGSSRSRRRAP